ncbi:hypothetical protein [Pseudoalteromonas luteoviolacea]|uniref:Hint domain-containing protein n=1 Tax=Pseudoalteromonas luteoviolacea S4060-1 TaxID=1365257 RepID=A0A167JNA7_9GAMM|nr:hypothetical protein [Pseudoalteromonas luteoviolacea]KZN61406.1 hypothetical protein N478_04885 [Pseudoalteromonas luteoviolacea S4060-1]
MKLNINMLFSASWITLVVSAPLAALSPDRIDKRCYVEDRLTYFEALGRNDWSLRCKYLSYRSYDYNVYDDWGNRRTALYFSSYYKPGNFNDWFAAPRVKNYSCENYQYRGMVTCLSDKAFGSSSLLFAPGERAIYDAYTQEVKQLIVVDETSTLESINLTEQLVSINSEKRDVGQVSIVKIITSSGQELVVTNEHPLLTSKGVLKNAQYLTSHDKLIRKDGMFDEIVSIESSEVTAQLFSSNINFKDAVQAGKSHLVVTQGFLSGYLVEDRSKEMSQRLAMRDALSAALIF